MPESGQVKAHSLLAVTVEVCLFHGLQEREIIGRASNPTTTKKSATGQHTVEHRNKCGTLPEKV
jgi:hypothetical protein